MGIKILLADDSVTAQNMGKKILSEAGHDVVTVSNGAAAAKKIAEVKPELVLLDVFMPGYSGLELCERLRNSVDTAKLPVLLTVGRMEPYSPQDGARVKADGVIVKPFEATDLTAAVERFAQKAKAEKEEPGKYERTIKIAPPPGSRDDTSRESQKVAVPSGETRTGYEQTMRLDAAQIAALLNTAAPKKQEPKAEEPITANIPEVQLSAVAAPALPAEEFRVEPAPTADFSKAEAAAPFVGNELLPEAHASASQPAQIPSYMAQYLDHSADDTVTARPAVGPSAEFDPEKTVVVAPREKAPAPAREFPGIEQLSPTIPISGEILSHRFPGDINPPPVASAQGLELTSVPPVADMPVAHESGLETLQGVDTPTIILQDPGLVTDRHRATMDFPTQFGTAEPPIADLSIPAQAATAPIDDFEARLQAAMSSYEPPSTDLPLPTPTEVPADLHLGLGSELPPSTDSQPELVTELPSPIGTSGFEELDEPFFATAPIGSTELALPEPVQPTELAHEVVPSNVVEFPSAALSASTTIESEYEKAIEEATSAVDASTPDVMAMSAQPAVHQDTVEQAEVMPLAMAAAATAAAPIAAPPHPNYEAEAELARALKAAMTTEADSTSVSFTVPEPPPSPKDANRLAAAVEKVMQRELPALIWKIMAELDLTKR